MALALREVLSPCAVRFGLVRCTGGESGERGEMGERCDGGAVAAAASARALFVLGISVGTAEMGCSEGTCCARAAM